MPQLLQTRREFLRSGLGLAAAASTIPSFLTRSVMAATDTQPTNDHRVLVVIQLSGGNDGLNTVIPFADDDYYRARPNIGIPADKLVKLNDTIGLHPQLAPLAKLYENGQLALVQGVGYPNPDRSHFRSMEIWQSAISEGFEVTGWVGRLFDHACANQQFAASPTLAASIDSTLNPALIGNAGIGVALDDPERFYKLTQFAIKNAEQPLTTTDSHLDFLRRTAMNAYVAASDIRTRAKSAKNQADYPSTGLARQLSLVARMIAGGMNTRIYYLTLGGFDTHARQTDTHARLLGELANAIKAFQDDLDSIGIADRVLGFTFSEFGRRVKENGSEGTDHGQAAPLFVFGKSAKPGIIGNHPSLQDLNRGDLKYAIDFRQLYATALDNWLGVDSKAILPATYKPLPVIA